MQCIDQGLRSARSVEQQKGPFDRVPRFYTLEAGQRLKTFCFMCPPCARSLIRLATDGGIFSVINFLRVDLLLGTRPTDDSLINTSACMRSRTPVKEKLLDHLLPDSL